MKCVGSGAWPLALLFLAVISGINALAQQSQQDGESPAIQLQHERNDGGGDHDKPIHVHLVSWNWHHVGVYITITLFVIFSGLAKVGFHHLHFISSRIPESCLLVVVGVAMGAVIAALENPPPEDGEDDDSSFTFPKFSPELFFFFLLPPIILEAAYSLYDNAFFDNLKTILVMAVIGTAFNFVMIGLLLYAVYISGAMGTIRGPFDDDHPEIVGEYDLKIVEVMTFASLISAVDPVAVLAIFQEVGVNPDLYFLLFGESLLNDGVAVVLYNMMNTFAEIEHSGAEVTIPEVCLGLVSFFTVALGGLTIGIIMGFLTALFTRCTTEVRVVEPLALFGMGYLAYITAELFHWSGIISLIGCGLVQAHYAFKNISKKSYTTVKYFIKMLSATSDCVIFLFLGIAVIEGPWFWHTGFVVWTIVFTLICRFAGTYGLTFLANRRRLKKVNLQEQFIMAYGGLRGAVGFSLVEMINADVIPPAQMFVTTTLAVVLFTIFIQGGTIKFLVNLLDIDKAKDERKMISEEINESVFQHTMAGIEVICGRSGSNRFGRWLERFDEEYLMKWFCKPTRQSEIIKLLEELAISDHLCNLYGPTMIGDTNMTKSDTLLRAIDEDELFSGESEGQFSDGGDILSVREDVFLSPVSSPSHTVGTGADPTLTRSRSPSFVSILRGDSIRSSGRHHGGSRRRLVSEGSSTTTGHNQSVKKSSAVERGLIKHALQNSPYNRYHQKHNVNLIDDDDQELETHLRRRHATARRLSTMAIASNQRFMDQMSQSGLSDHSLAGGETPRRTRHTSLVSPPLYHNDNALAKVPAKDRNAVEAILSERARRISNTSEGQRLALAARRLSISSASSQGSSQLHNHGPPPLTAKGSLVRTASVPLKGRKTSAAVNELSKVVEEADDGNGIITKRSQSEGHEEEREDEDQP